MTNGGRTCSTFAHCKALLDAGEGIAYAGSSGGLGIDAEGDISSARLVTSTVVEGLLLETATDEIDLVALRHAHLLSAAMVTTQLQQALKALGYFDGDVTGYFDAETADARAGAAGGPRRAGDRRVRRGDRRGPAGPARCRRGDAHPQHGPAAARAAGPRVLRRADRRALLGGDDRRGAGVPGPHRRAPDRGAGHDHVAPDLRAGAAEPAAAAAPAAAPAGHHPAAAPARHDPAASAPPPPVTDPPPPVTDPPPPPSPILPPPPSPSLRPAADRPPPPPPPPPPPTTTEPPTTTTTEPPAPVLPTMYEALAADPRFSTFVGLLRDAGFARDLDVPAPGFTIFAPTNDAFDRMDPEERAAWTSDPGAAARPAGVPRRRSGRRRAGAR